jgi:glycosyltransferase involved in cell wall biosynthesis
MAPEWRRRFPLVLVGGDWADGRARAEATARDLGVADEVRFEGWVDDAFLPSLYRGARALVLSTREETFGRCVAEAMASGCPCVLQDLPVLREVAADAAEFLDFSNVAQAGLGLERICRDDARAEALRAAGLRRAQAFSFSQLAGERVREIRKILSVKRGVGF